MSKLTRAPVFFTLAQMRFNPVLDMSDFLPALQEAFRKEGYTDYEAANFQGLALQQNEDGFSISQKSAVRHVFRTKGQTAAVVLDPAALTYELTDYPVFEDFSAAFLRALGIVHEHRPIDFYDRLGMRMLDAVQSLDGEGLDRYVVPPVLGLKEIMGEAVEHQQTLIESLFRIGRRTLLVRAIASPNGIRVPVDLAPLRLQMAPRFLEHQGESITLDSDCFQDERADFSIEVTRADLKELKAALARSFKSLVTPHALKVWE